MARKRRGRGRIPSNGDPAGEGAPPRSDDPPRGRGRRPNRWIEGLTPEQLLAYRERFGLSERRLGEYLGVSVPTIRNWTKGGKAPAEERQRAIADLLGRDYAPPPPGAAPAGPRRRGRPPRAAESQAPGDGPLPPPRTLAQSVADLAAAYLRTPGGQHLTPEQLLQLLDKLQRALR